MKLPKPVAPDGLRKSTQIRFNGYEALSTEGGICHMKNMTSEYWPELASRPKRKIVQEVTAPRGIGSGPDRIVWCDGRDLHYGDTVVENLLPESDEERTLVMLGDYLTIWPDKLYYDTVSGVSGSLEASVTKSDVLFRSAKAPDGISDTDNCITVSAGGLDGFRAGDALTISGCFYQPKNNQTVIVREIAATDLTETTWSLYTLDGGVYPEQQHVWTADRDYPENTLFWFWNPSGSGHLEVLTVTIPFTLYEGVTLKLHFEAEHGTPDYVLMADSIRLELTPGDGLGGVAITFEDEDAAEANYTEPGPITIARTVPDMDFVFAHDNRLFGCKGDVIYASKLGDPFNWNVYDGTASDSWTTETGTLGVFTGGISYGGYPRFFKEQHIITLYGDYPGEYQLQIQAQIGVARHSARSLAVANARLFYLSPMGPCVYTGGTPQLIADAFGVTRYKNAVSGSNGVTWYVSMQDAEEKWHLFAFDTRRWMWLREDNLHATGFAQMQGDVYCQGADGKIYILGRAVNAPAGAKDEAAVDWMVEFGDITARSPDHKRVTKVQLRLELEEFSRVEVQLRYDGEHKWRPAADVTAKRKRSVVVPVIPRRLDHFRLKLSGKGRCRISSLSIESAAGSDRR